MDSPIWSNDLLYVQELIVITIVTVAITAYCFMVSRRADRRRAARLANAKVQAPEDGIAPDKTIPHPPIRR